jgi:transposase
MLDHRSNAFVESMNGQLQQAKRAARGYRTAKNFIAIAYLRLSRLKNLAGSPVQRRRDHRVTRSRSTRNGIEPSAFQI